MSDVPTIQSPRRGQRIADTRILSFPHELLLPRVLIALMMCLPVPNGVAQSRSESPPESLSESLWESLSTSPSESFVTDSGTVQFHSRVPLHNFTGTSHQLNGLISLADSTIDFYVDLSTLDTGNGRRDRDMRKTLDVESHPFAEFVGTLATATSTASEPGLRVVAEGTFTIHGVSQPLRVEGTLTPTPDWKLLLTAEWKLSLADYNIRPPRILMVKVEDTQTIEISVTLTPRE